KVVSGISLHPLGSEDFFEPPLINEKQEQSFLQKILADPRTTITDKALTVMYHNMRQQIFWDGNKRTATLSALNLHFKCNT
ncbi:Fic family protein, partial [Lentilactobacillus buchneri]